MSSEQLESILKKFGIVGSLGMVWMSSYFSQDGFGVEIPTMAWMGWLFAAFIIVVEMIWNTEGFHHNPTINMAGMVAYTYGITTNVIGIMHIQGITLDAVWANPLKLGVPLVIGFFLEVVAEPILVWSLVGVSEDDLLSHMGKLMVGWVTPRKAQSHNPQPQMQFPKGGVEIKRPPIGKGQPVGMPGVSFQSGKNGRDGGEGHPE